MLAEAYGSALSLALAAAALIARRLLLGGAWCRLLARGPDVARRTVVLPARFVPFARSGLRGPTVTAFD